MERMAAFAKGGFRINRVSAEHARRWGKQGPQQMVARLREIAEDRSRPVGIAGHKVYGTAEALLLAIRVDRSAATS